MIMTKRSVFVVIVLKENPMENCKPIRIPSEIMMKGIFDILEDASIPAQYSLERYMKCALGVCGQCCVDNQGWRICVEGPVFENDKISQITEFAKYRRDASGLKY